MADSVSVPIEDSFEKPNPLQETGDQRDYAVTLRQQQQQGRVTEPTEENALEDPAMWAKFVQLMFKLVHTVGNFSLANFFAILYAAAIAIPKILSEWEMPKEQMRQRDQMKMKDKEKEVTVQLNKIGQQKKDLEEKIMKALEYDHPRISYTENRKLEMDLITTTARLAICGFGMSFLQGLVGRLESEAQSTVWWINFQLTTGLSVVCGMLYHYWRYTQETSETGTTVGSLLVLGMVIFFCAHKARVRFNNKELVDKCQLVRNELEETKEAYRTYKQAVEITLPELKKLLVVVDHDVSLYRSLQGLKRKDE